MGYDVTVIKTDYHRWFSIWNWHRCLLLTLYGAGLFEDDVFSNKMMQVSALQNSEQPQTQEEEDKFLVRKAELAKADKSEQRIVQHQLDRDDDGYVIGGNIAVPMGKGEVFDERMERMLMSTMRIQAETTSLLLDNKDEFGLTKDECITLASMDGGEINDKKCSLLFIGCAMGLIATGHNKEVISENDEFRMQIRELFQVDNPSIRDEKQAVKLAKGIDSLFDKGGESNSNLVLDELWDPEEMFAIAKFFGIMAESISTFSPIRID